VDIVEGDMEVRLDVDVDEEVLLDVMLLVEVAEALLEVEEEVAMLYEEGNNIASS